MKNIILALSLITSSSLLAGPPIPKQAKKAPEVKYECVTSENSEFEISVIKGLREYDPITLIVDGERIVVQDMGTLAIYNAIIEEEPTGTYEGEKYYTIGIEPNIANCSREK